MPSGDDLWGAGTPNADHNEKVAEPSRPNVSTASGNRGGYGNK